MNALFQNFSSIVLSVILLCPDENTTLPLESLSKSLQENFPYYELIVIFNPMPSIETRENYLMQFLNARSVVLNDYAPEYTLRERALEACIGDQVLFWDSSMTEIEFIHQLVESNMQGNDFTGLVYSSSDASIYGIWSRMFNAFLNKLTGYSLNPRLSPVGCYSRSLVNAVNSRKFTINYLKLFLASVGFRCEFIHGGPPPHRTFWQAIRRLTESLEIIGSVPMRLLQITAWTSLASFIGCILYIAYVFVVWLTFSAVQSGWISTSTALGGCFSIFFFGMFVFSCIALHGLGKEKNEKFVIARERSRSDFIQQFSKFNVTDEQ